MRHRARSRRLGRSSAHRWAMVRNMVTSLLEHGRVETTDARAKEVKRVAERMITLGKRGTLHARRRALRVIRDRGVATRVFGDLAERFRERPGGYTRVLKLGRRVGDAAPVSILELVEGPAAEAAKPAAGRKRAGARAKAEPKADKAAPRKAASERKGASRPAAAGKAGKGGKGKAKGGEAAARQPAAPRKAGRSSKSD